MLNLFPIRFLIDKVQKTKKIVICRIMKNFVTITAAGVTQCEFSITMQISSNPSILNRVVPQVLLQNLTQWLLIFN